jgi:ADP-ribose pyrophosphatase YjhB (NUDIX family)
MAGWQRPRKRSAFVYLVRETDHSVYCVENRQFQLGVPGGKQETYDIDDLDTARREFEEETGAVLPAVGYDHVQYGDQHHVCTMYYALLSELQCSQLPLGDSPDPAGAEKSVMWARMGRSEARPMRRHISRGWGLIVRMCTALGQRRRSAASSARARSTGDVTSQLRAVMQKAAV